MRELFLRALFFLRRYPVLWVPVLVADFLIFWLRHLQVIAARAIVRMLLQDHSVLGAPGEGSLLSHPELLGKISLIIQPLSWAVYLVVVFLYGAAMMATVALVRMAIRREDVRLPEALVSVRIDAYRLLVFSLKLLGLLLVASLVMLGLSSMMIGVSRLIPVYNSSLLLSTLLMMGIAFLAVPWAMRLLREGEELIGSEQMRVVRGFAVGAVVASALLSLLVLAVQPALIAGIKLLLVGALVGVVCSLVTALPYGVMFVAFGVVSVGDKSRLG